MNETLCYKRSHIIYTLKIGMAIYIHIQILRNHIGFYLSARPNFGVNYPLVVSNTNILCYYAIS